MRLSKEEFVDVIADFQKVVKEWSKLSEALGIKTANWAADDWINRYYHCIEVACGLGETEKCDLDYFVWDTDFGTACRKEIEDFYDYMSGSREGIIIRAGRKEFIFYNE